MQPGMCELAAYRSMLRAVGRILQRWASDEADERARAAFAGMAARSHDHASKLDRAFPALSTHDSTDVCRSLQRYETAAEVLEDTPRRLAFLSALGRDVQDPASELHACARLVSHSYLELDPEGRALVGEILREQEETAAGLRNLAARRATS